MSRNAEFYEYPLYLCDDCLRSDPHARPSPMAIEDDEGTFYTCLHVAPRAPGALAGRARVSMTLILEGDKLAAR